MGEGLGEVAQLISAGTDLLGEQADVVGVRLPRRPSGKASRS
jgi:hypothetical protein